VNDADRQLVDTLRRDGIAVLPDLLSADEVAAVRAEFDRSCLDAGKGLGDPGVRDGVSGDALLAYPSLAALFWHPRILSVVTAMLEQPTPWVWVLKTNRYTPDHDGVRRHTDGFLGELSPPFSRQAMAVFLDDIDVDSGALTYVPGSHRLHFEDAGEPQRQPPTQEQIDAGDYVPASLKAGSVLFRVPEVWHAVNPIHRLRRYVTASYMSRGGVSVEMERRAAKERQRRRDEGNSHVPRDLRTYYAVD
jgi:ectoine hydroxylase-related dioxygenase (phytanoyl-CoA dioxygenase family)